MYDRHVRLGLSTVVALSLLCGSTSSTWGQGFTIGANFTGTDVGHELQSSFAETGCPCTFQFPPDTMGAVGPNHVVELLNGAFAVYDKMGNNLVRSSMNKFWNDGFTAAGTAAVSNGSFDPRLLYDKHSARWYAFAVDERDTASSRVHVGVTIGNDPSPANWRAFVIDADFAGTRWADFPTVGIDASGVYISNNMFDNPGGAAETSTVTVMGVPKSSLTAAVPSISGNVKQENIAPGGTGFSMQPAVDLDNSGLPLPALSAFNNTNLSSSFALFEALVRAACRCLGG